MCGGLAMAMALAMPLALATSAAADNPAQIALRVHTAPVAGEFYGMRIGSAGDVNNDDVPDYFVGAPSAWHGVVRVYSGETGDMIRVFTTPSTIDLFGFAVAALGDVNGDGSGDLAIGAPLREFGTSMLGAVDVVSGATGMLLWTASGSESLDCFGWSLASAGDINGDGASDVIVGRPFHDSEDGGLNSGAVTVLSGANGAVIHTFDGPSYGGQTGLSVAGPGDVNGDGVPDIAYATPQYGLVHVRSGASGANLGEIESQGGSRFGWSMDAAGDVDGDGVGDLIVGAPNFAIGGEPCGRAAIYSGANLSLIHGFNGEDGSTLGYAVAGAGDIDQDGYDDVLIGIPKHPFGLERAGRIEIHSGVDGRTLRVINGAFNRTRFGSAVAGFADITADEVPEFLVAHERYGEAVGAAYVFEGTAGAPGEAHAAHQAGQWTNAGAGCTADLDDDGAGDLLTIGSALDRVTVRMNSGDGTFHGAAHLAVGDAPSSVALADLDGDDDLDMIVALANENRLAIYSNAMGILLRSGTIKVGRKPIGVVARDFDNDHRVDLAVINRRDNNLMIMLQRGSPSANYLHERFHHPRRIDLPAEPASLSLAHLNSDSRADLVIVSRAGSQVFGLLGRPHGRFTEPRVTTLQGMPASASVGDFDDDGRDDLAWCDGVSAQLIMQSSTGAGRFGAAAAHALQQTPNSLQTLDINHDGIDDIVTANAADNSASMLFMGAAGPWLIATHGTVDQPRWIATGDLDEDADPDMVLINAQGAATLLFNHIW